MRRSLLLFLSLQISLLSVSGAEYYPDLTFDPPELPASQDEFALMARDAVQAVWLLRRAMFIQQLDPVTGQRQTVTVRNARVVSVERKLYTIYIDGQPLDWDHSYIRYNGRMTNLRMLFSYRNQPHPFDRPLYLE